MRIQMIIVVLHLINRLSHGGEAHDSSLSKGCKASLVVAITKNPSQAIDKEPLTRHMENFKNEYFPDAVQERLIEVRQNRTKPREIREHEINILLAASPAAGIFSEPELINLSYRLTAPANFEYSVGQILSDAMVRLNQNLITRAFSAPGATTIGLIDSYRSEPNLSDSQKFHGILRALKYDVYIESRRIHDFFLQRLARRLLDEDWKRIKTIEAVGGFLKTHSRNEPVRLDSIGFTAIELTQMDQIRTRGPKGFSELMGYISKTDYCKSLDLSTWDLSSIASELVNESNKGKSTERVLQGLRLR